MNRKHPLAHCEACPLNVTGVYVPTLHSTNPKLVVVGEAPGFQEANVGEPFVGSAGKLLDRVLQHYGYSREEVTYTNTILCRSKDNATPKEAIAACRERLLDEIRESGTEDVLALGSTAIAACCADTRTIKQIRVGPPKEPTAALNGSNVKRVVPTWHPSYCLRNPDAFPSMAGDIGKLKEQVERVWSPPQWIAVDDPDDALAVVAELHGRTDRLVVDIEVGIEKDVSFGHPNEYDLLCLGIAYAKGKAVVFGSGALSDRRVLDALKRLLQVKRLIAHNGKFDLAGLYPVFGALELWFDTMLANYCLDERPGNHGLKANGVERLGTPQWDEELAKYIPKGGNYANIPRPILYKYNAWDVAVTWDLLELYIEALEREGMRGVHDFMIAASNQLMYLELNGIAIDKPYMAQLRTEFRARLDEIEDQIDKIVATSTELAEGAKRKIFNPRSPKQIREYMEAQGHAVPKTDEDTLTRLLERLYRYHPDGEAPVIKFIITLLKHRRQQKLFSTYVEGIRKRMYRGRVHTTYMLHGTTSGRLASRNPNLQNIVRDKAIRKQFAPTKEENVFIQCDFKQAEGRVITYLAQDEYLKEIFNNPDIDLFSELSDQLYGVGNWDKENRVRTKAFFYGVGYGREPFSIALEYGMTPREAEKLYNDFMALIPNVVRWQNGIRQSVLRGEDLVTPFGRRRRFQLITKENRSAVLNEALSFLPQSTASDICLGALTVLRPMLRGLGFLRLTIHDALVAECHRDKADEVAAMIQSVMEQKGREFTDYVPFPVDISVGRSWGEL